jgi:hypothetical protein
MRGLLTSHPIPPIEPFDEGSVVLGAALRVRSGILPLVAVVSEATKEVHLVGPLSLLAHP